MKQKFLIITFLVFSIMGAFALKANAQTEYDSNSKLSDIREMTLADETTITDTKTGAKIKCSNDKVHFKLYGKWHHTFIHYGWVWKKDRHGPYKFYVITVSQKDAELIKVWAKSNL